MATKIIDITARWLFICCIPVLLFTASIAGAVNCRQLYLSGFAKYEVNQSTGISGEQLVGVATGLIEYFNSGEDDFNVTVVRDGQPMVLFNQREVIHLQDVKGLIRLDYYLLLATLVYVVAYAGVALIWRRRRSLAWAVVAGGGLTLGLMLALGLGIALGFDQLFLQFHFISFSNELWRLDPARDYLIRLFPSGFFFDAATYCTLAIAGGAVIPGGVAGIYLRVTRRRSQ